MKNRQPSKFILKFFKWFCDPALHRHIEGDLLELYSEREKDFGKGVAERQLWRDVLMLFRPDIIKPIKTTTQLNSYDMFSNYFKISLRNLLKYKAFSAINVFGLAVAMSICMLLILMIADQKGYDQFHRNKEKIYRVLTHAAKHSRPYATSPFSTAAELKATYPAIENATTLTIGVGGDAIYKGNYATIKGYFADPSFLNILNFILDKGNASSALELPNSMIISKQIAEQLFGIENPLGKVVDFTDQGLDFFSDEGGNPTIWGRYTITGVLGNSGKSHLEFDALISSASMPILVKEKKINHFSEEWTNFYRSYTYVQLADNAYEKDLIEILDQFAADKFNEDENLKGSRFVPQLLSQITPGPALGNAPTTRLPMFVFYILSLLALIIIISACLNYTNLSIARALTRSKEIGIRKVSGARKKDLVFQFLSESIITAFIALILANILLVFVKSAFMGLWINKYLSFDLSINIYVYIIFIGFTVLIGLIAGLFPAISLSKFHAIKALKGVGGVGNGRIGVRKTLTVVQFVFSLLFIVSSLVIYNQFNHILKHKYGFNPENVVNINLQSNDFDQVKNAFNSISGVSILSGCAYLPATGRNDNMHIKVPDSEMQAKAIDLGVDQNFIKVLGINLIAGKHLPDVNSSEAFVLVNEQTVQDLGYDHPKDIIGEFIEARGDQLLKVRGVIENITFHMAFYGKATGPIVLSNHPERFKYITLKIQGDKADVIAQLKSKWKVIDPIHPLNYEFYEDRLANNNQGIFDIVSIIGFIAFLAVTIACLGLLGMAIFTTERRTKEVGIRKVLGAGDIKLALLLAKEFLNILAIAVMIAAPLSYFLNNLWLNALVERVDFGFGTVALGALILLIMGVFTIWPQTMRIANHNPVNTLKNE